MGETTNFITYVSPKRRKLARLTKEPRALATFDARGGGIVIVIVLPIRSLGRASSEGGEERHDDD